MKLAENVKKTHNGALIFFDEICQKCEKTHKGKPMVLAKNGRNFKLLRYSITENNISKTFEQNLF